MATIITVGTIGPRRPRMQGRHLLMAWAATAALAAGAQSSSNNCNTAAANKYPVNSTCVGNAFNKPTSYTANYNPGGCQASNHDDAWGWFTATSPWTIVSYTPQSGTDAILHVLDACGGNVVGCANNGANGATERLTIPTVAGNNYHVRVQRRNNNNAMNGTLCIMSADCVYQVHLFDYGGNGWGSAYITITVDGVSLGNHSLSSGSEGVVDVPVSNGSSLVVTYYRNGSYSYQENSFSITADGQCLQTAQSSMSNGYSATIAAQCPPDHAAAVDQDCMGGETVCSNTSITNSSTGMGCRQDLNDSNRGCLYSGERQGTWYYFSPTVAGTLGFSLTPHDSNDDYDFALWGPFDNAACPSGEPARCSYYDGRFYGNTTTGMGNGATDHSEGAYNPGYSQHGPANGWVAPMDMLAGKVYILYINNYSSTGQAFDLEWDLGGGASLNCTTLPVELLALEARPQGSTIEVTWSTASERNADHYTVEHSTDNTSFGPIGKVDAAGNSQSIIHYGFTDPRPATGANYYRLQQVDRDGTHVHTQSVVAFMDLPADQPPLLFPNPAHDQLMVAFHTPRDGTVTLLVQDAVGRVVLFEHDQMPKGTQQLTLDIGGLANGWYSLRLMLPNGGLLSSKGFLKQ